MPDNITALGLIDLFRLVVEGFKSGRIKANEVDAMTDESVWALISQLQSEDQAKIDQGRELDPS